jgi:formylglycine-generating enzyme required for sulfatase activity
VSYSPLLAADVNDPLGMRQGSAGWLSLALMDARNRSLRWLAALEGVSTTQPLEGFDPPAWLVGQAAWFQEFWISRCPQRNRGAQADPMGVRLASIDPRVDTWFAPGALTRLERWGVAPSASEGLRDYLAATLDTTMELLDKADGSETSLYFFRQALLHEDRVAETLAELARALGLALPADGPTVPAPPARARREPVGFASGTVWLGTPGDGFAPDNERPAREVQVPAFEVDAQVVCWAEFAEFAADGGFDDPRWWAPSGWDWIEAHSRRAPRYVEQLIEGVLVQRAGRIERASPAQAALHLSWYEADAWCRWAGRRLPSEAEWALAMGQARARGLAWGDGFEWLAGSAQPWPGQNSGPAGLDTAPATHPGQPAGGSASPAHPWRMLRGASAVTVPRQRHPGARRVALSHRDDLFCAFRSCAV